MTFSNVPAKLDHLIACAGLSSRKDFADRLFEEKGIRRDVSMHWFGSDNIVLRKNLQLLIEFFETRRITLTRFDFRRPLDEFKREIQQSPLGHTVTNISPGIHEYLLGRYQIIRPHVSLAKTYILEAMEIEYKNGQYVHSFISHTQPHPDFLYSGIGYAEPRYYFAMLSRRHEDFPERQSHRCILFHTEERHATCLSGVMLRGVHGGTDGKEAAAVPFIALKITQARSLDEIDSTPVSTASGGESSLSRLHPGGVVLVGEVREHDHKSIFDLCRTVFSDEDFIKATRRDQKLIIRTVPVSVLKQIDVIGEQSWMQAVASAPRAMSEASSTSNVLPIR